MNSHSSLSRDSRKPFLLFLFIYLIFSFLTFRHYGVTWDEFDTYMSGGQWLKYYMGQPNILFSTRPDQRDIFATHSYFNGGIIRLLTFAKTILPDRTHLVNMLLAIPIFWCFFELMRVCFKDWRLALAGPFILILTPRFFGDIPANPKDVPFAVAYFLCLTVIALRREWLKKEWQQNVLLGLAFGLAMGLRIVAFTLLPIYALFRIYEDGLLGKKWDPKFLGKWLLREAGGFLIIVVVSQVLLSFLWPFIGKDYFHHIWYTFAKSASLGFDKKILFMGRVINPFNQFLWYYLPGWISVITPLFILFFSLFSLARFKRLFRNKFYFLMVLALTFNLALYFMLKPEILNGIRHYLFLMPILSFLALLGIVDLFQNVSWRPGLALAGLFIAVNVLSVTVDMVRLYPYDYVYFNELVGGLKGAQGRFELDYWGASLREATEWLRDNECKDPKRNYKIRLACDQWQEAPFLPPNMVGYTEFTKKEADYWMVLNEINDDNPPPASQVIHTVEREGVPLSYVVKSNK